MMISVVTFNQSSSARNLGGFGSLLSKRTWVGFNFNAAGIIHKNNSETERGEGTHKKTPQSPNPRDDEMDTCLEFIKQVDGPSL